MTRPAPPVVVQHEERAVERVVALRVAPVVALAVEASYSIGFYHRSISIRTLFKEKNQAKRASGRVYRKDVLLTAAFSRLYHG